MFSFSNKKNYFCSYYKRILRVLIPYWLIDFIILIYFLAFHLDFNLRNWIISILTIQISPQIATYWFVSAIIVMYLCFYLSFKVLSKGDSNVKLSIYLMNGCTIIYSVICISFLSLPGTYTSTIFSFVFGMIWYLNRDKIQKIIRTNFSISVIITIIWFFGIFIKAKMIDHKISLPYQNWLSFIINNITSISFVIMIMVWLQRITLKGIISSFLGKISYEIYIVHITVLGFLKSEQVKYSNTYFILFIVLTAILITLIYIISQEINKRINNTCFKRKLQ